MRSSWMWRNPYIKLHLLKDLLKQYNFCIYNSFLSFKSYVEEKKNSSIFEDWRLLMKDSSDKGAILWMTFSYVIE